MLEGYKYIKIKDVLELMNSIANVWPVLSGNYIVDTPESNIAIVTLTNKFIFPKGLCAISGEMKTENLGIERVIINTVSNANIRYIIVCGKESKGHSAGQSLIAIYENGIDEKNKIIGSKGAIPFIENVPREVVERFRKQIKKIVDLINEEDINKIIEVANSLPKEQPFEEGYYVLKEVEEVKKETLFKSGNDVAVSEGIYLDPNSFAVCD